MKSRISFGLSNYLSAWKYLRLSAVLLIPLVWFHAVLNTLFIGAENLSLNLIAGRWATIGWRVYDILLLAFAFSHGVLGLRQILFDFKSNRITKNILNVVLFLFWLGLSLIGAIGIIRGVIQ